MTNKEWNETELKELASQLSCPSGENGIKVGAQMEKSNSNMTRSTIDSMNLTGGERVLEIGPGNASHLSYLFDQASNLTYQGADISETMIGEAQKSNAALMAKNNIAFTLSNGRDLPFERETFHKIFTVNTLYFWPDPAQYATEFFRVLKQGGHFHLAFAQKDFMQKLPFTQYGFQLYDAQKAETLLVEAGFSIKEVLYKTEEVMSNAQTAVKRDFVIVVASK
ncbi:class I SAM-dependent methyltransferase [Tellurirhabdus bombi]|uniref:class I SAM-dependent methyltransferase n=1 Tax=Tellurirhabdus bombi TaxID=2907205 RepID=UPI001F38C38C|nr:class I SAM-dependent methyltransferase [Tellurirhabdus bombi]